MESKQSGLFVVDRIRVACVAYFAPSEMAYFASRTWRWIGSNAGRSIMAPASTHGEHFAEVVLVRHGQTDWNVSRIIQVARRLSEEAKPAAVYSSDLKRASETAQTIAAHCCVSDSDLVIDRALTERHGGLFQGERVVVVSHEAVIEEICRHADPTISVGRKIPNTSISVVHISGSDGRWILEKFGDAGHLIGDGFPQSTL
uniref:Histidine phosphatase family protein n=1 Tax=Setaria italica TaxID=4555 RepID=K3ZM01_SETIT